MLSCFTPEALQISSRLPLDVPPWTLIKYSYNQRVAILTSRRFSTNTLIGFRSRGCITERYIDSDHSEKAVAILSPVEFLFGEEKVQRPGGSGFCPYRARRGIGCPLRSPALRLDRFKTPFLPSRSSQRTLHFFSRRIKGKVLP